MIRRRVPSLRALRGRRRRLGSDDRSQPGALRLARRGGAARDAGVDRHGADVPAAALVPLPARRRCDRRPPRPAPAPHRAARRRRRRCTRAGDRYHRRALEPARARGLRARLGDDLDVRAAGARCAPVRGRRRRPAPCRHRRDARPVRRSGARNAPRRDRRLGRERRSARAARRSDAHERAPDRRLAANPPPSEGAGKASRARRHPGGSAPGMGLADPPPDRGPGRRRRPLLHGTVSRPLPTPRARPLRGRGPARAAPRSSITISSRRWWRCRWT